MRSVDGSVGLPDLALTESRESGSLSEMRNPQLAIFDTVEQSLSTFVYDWITEAKRVGCAQHRKESILGPTVFAQNKLCNRFSVSYQKLSKLH